MAEWNKETVDKMLLDFDNEIDDLITVDSRVLSELDWEDYDERMDECIRNADIDALIELMESVRREAQRISSGEVDRDVPEDVYETMTREDKPREVVFESHVGTYKRRFNPFIFGE